jgi:hypothetical protein
MNTKIQSIYVTTYIFRGDTMPILKRGSSTSEFDDDVSALFESRKGNVCVNV